MKITSLHFHKWQEFGSLEPVMSVLLCCQVPAVTTSSPVSTRGNGKRSCTLDCQSEHPAQEQRFLSLADLLHRLRTSHKHGQLRTKWIVGMRMKA